MPTIRIAPREGKPDGSRRAVAAAGAPDFSWIEPANSGFCQPILAARQP